MSSAIATERICLTRRDEFDPAVSSGEPLWFAIEFPALSLEIQAAQQPTFAAVVEDHRRGPRIHTVSGAARKAGVATGMSVSSALAVCPELSIYSLDPNARQRRLQGLARCCRQFSPTVSLEPPAALVLEVRASLRLFGGPASLWRSLTAALTEQGHRFDLAAAPTPRAALLLARAQRAELVLTRGALRSALGELPIAQLRLDPKLLRGLYGIGARTLRDLWRLPGAELTRRFGTALRRELEQILGAHPDPRPILDPPLRFHARSAFDSEMEDCERILAVIEQLLQRLGRFLRARDRAVSRVALLLEHTRHPPSRFFIGTRQPTRDAEHLRRLCAERLQHTLFPAPVVSVGLTADEVQDFSAKTQSLFRQERRGEPWLQICEQIEARLGYHLHQTQLVADHRPERASLRVQADHAHGAPGTPREAPLGPAEKPLRRPLWLLPQPRLLRQRDGRSWRQGDLEILDGPERIESGWWDGADCRRDYYRARHCTGTRLWIFQDLVSGAWYLHGLFG